MTSYRHGALRRLLQRVLIRTESKIGRNFAALHGNLFLGELRLRLKALCVYDDEKSLRGSHSVTKCSIFKIIDPVFHIIEVTMFLILPPGLLIVILY